MIRAHYRDEWKHAQGLPPASDVTITRADGSTEIVPSKRPIDEVR
jgi:hypothetical protein